MIFKIVCHDKKSFEISEQQKEAIYRLSTKNVKGFDVNGEYIMFSSIARIEKSDAPEYKPIKSFPQEKISYSKAKHQRRLDSLKKGFLKGVSNPDNLTPYQEKMMGNMKKTLLGLKKTP